MHEGEQPRHEPAEHDFPAPHAVPSVTSVHAIAVTTESHAWHAFAGLRVPLDLLYEPMRHGGTAESRIASRPTAASCASSELASPTVDPSSVFPQPKIVSATSVEIALGRTEATYHPLLERELDSP